LHQKDRVLLESIRNYFNGVGSIYKEKKKKKKKKTEKGVGGKKGGKNG